MKKIYFTFFALFLIASQVEASQTDSKADSSKVIPGRKNLIKLNLPTLALRTYALEYERAIGKKTALSLGYRFMPKGGIPLKGVINDLINDEETYKQLNTFDVSNNAITPQIKFYFGKDIFKGFYLAPFARFATYKVDGLYNYDADEDGIDEQIPMQGELKTITGGLELGVNFRLSKRIHLNINAGPQFGSSKGNFDGNKSLSTLEQDKLREDLKDLEIPFADTEVTVDGNGAHVKLDGPWAGFKAGIMLGFRF
ncbi:MAG TPA: DUF3575 domain-containing protein [Pelobium sp.]|nr:DUF3575 domain-containing protein [Pelobium sp.]